MKVSSMILAKSQSRRLLNKNTLDYEGKPMFVWNLLKCLEVFGECYVSSDSDEILKIAKEYGARTILRGEELCGETPNIPVYKHAMRKMRGDAFIAVQACSPKIDVGLIVQARDIMISGCPEIMTCYPLQHKTTFAPESYENQSFLIYGSIWGMTRKRLENYKDFYHPTPEVLLVDNSIDIHTKEDL